MTQLLRSLIRQVLLESDGAYKPEAPADALLGKYAFANIRARSPRPPPEEDTKTEEAILEELHMHFRDNVPLSKKTTDQILDFIDQGLYSDIFKAPPAGTLYRGLSVKDRSIVEKLLQKNGAIDGAILQTAKRTTDFASFETQLDLTNRDERYTASWTKSLGQAKQFAYASDARFQVILCATVENNPGKWIDCEGFYGLRNIDEYEEESEVIAVGTIRVSEVKVKVPLSVMKLYELEQLKKLPKDQRVMNGHVDLSRIDNVSLPEGLHVKGNLDISYASITSLPEGLVVEGDLNLTNTPLISLPEGLHVKGNLILSYSFIRSLPKGLVVNGNLYLFKVPITALPEDLQVDGYISEFEDTYRKNVPEHLKDKLI